jgi:hypothetical protein
VADGGNDKYHVTGKGLSQDNGGSLPPFVLKGGAPNVCLLLQVSPTAAPNHVPPPTTPSDWSNCHPKVLRPVLRPATFLTFGRAIKSLLRRPTTLLYRRLGLLPLFALQTSPSSPLSSVYPAAWCCAARRTTCLTRAQQQTRRPSPIRHPRRLGPSPPYLPGSQIKSRRFPLQKRAQHFSRKPHTTPHFHPATTCPSARQALRPAYRRAHHSPAHPKIIAIHCRRALLSPFHFMAGWQ